MARCSIESTGVEPDWLFLHDFSVFFSIKLFDRVKIGIFSNRLNHWTQIYLKFSKLVLLFRIDIQKVTKNCTKHRWFWKKLHFPLPCIVLIRTTKWAAMAINVYAGFLDGELMSILKKSKKFWIFLKWRLV